MFRTLSALVFSVFLFFGNTASASDNVREQLKKMPQQYSQFDVKIGWDLHRDGDKTIISGLIQNLRYAAMDSIEVWVTSRDTDGRQLDRSVGFVVPGRLMQDLIAPFTVKIPVKVQTGTKMTFTYRYLGRDGGGPDEEAVNWMQSFEVIAP